MADQKLVSYIKNSLARGINPSTIKVALMRNGYSMQQVEEAFGQASFTQVHHIISFSPVLMGLIIALVVAGAAFGYFVYSSSSPTKATQLLDVNLEPITSLAKPGEHIEVLKEITNMGSAKGYDVELKTELVHAQTGEVIASKTETRAIETIGSTKTQLQVPTTAQPGEYIVRTIALYEGKRAVASLRVLIEKPTTTQTTAPSCQDGIQNQDEEQTDCGGTCSPCPQSQQEIECNDYNPCTTDAIVDGECTLSTITPCCGNGQCEAQEQSCLVDCPASQDTTSPGLVHSQSLEEIKLVATTNPQQASQQCAQQELPSYKYTCYTNVAQLSKDKSHCFSIDDEQFQDVCLRETAEHMADSSICQDISNEERRDTCYLGFVTGYKDYSVCEEIFQENLRQSCFQLRMLSQS